MVDINMKLTYTHLGMIDCLHGLGHRLLALGYGTPFLVRS